MTLYNEPIFQPDHDRLRSHNFYFRVYVTPSSTYPSGPNQLHTLLTICNSNECPLNGRRFFFPPEARTNTPPEEEAREITNKHSWNKIYSPAVSKVH